MLELRETIWKSEKLETFDCLFHKINFPVQDTRFVQFSVTLLLVISPILKTIRFVKWALISCKLL